MLALAAKTIPGASTRSRPKIDYLGVLFVALGASGLSLAVSWAGSRYAWTSPVIIAMFAGSIGALVIFVLVERRAVEPILPMRLFGKPVFSIASLLSFIVGFAMLGALTSFRPICNTSAAPQPPRPESGRCRWCSAC